MSAGSRSITSAVHTQEHQHGPPACTECDVLRGPSQLGHFEAQPQTPQSAHFMRSHLVHKESCGGGVGKHSRQSGLAH